MKRLLIPVFAVVLAAMMFIPGIPSVSGAVEVEVTGIIRDESGANVQGVLVEVEVAGILLPTDFTNADGEFSIPGVDMSEARIRFWFGDTPIFVSMTDFSNGWYSLANYGSFGGILGVLKITTETGFVEGRVVNDEGQPLNGVRVTFEGHGKNMSVTTNSDGMYFVDNLDTGAYVVTAERSGFKTERANAVVTKSDALNRQPGPDFVLTSTSAEYLLGMDLEHSLMVIGFVLGLIITSISILYAVQMKRRQEEELERS